MGSIPVLAIPTPVAATTCLESAEPIGWCNFSLLTFCSPRRVSCLALRYLELLKEAFNPGTAGLGQYFSYETDLTLTQQRAAALAEDAVSGAKPAWGRADARFFFNRAISQPLIGGHAFFSFLIRVPIFQRIIPLSRSFSLPLSFFLFGCLILDGHSRSFSFWRMVETLKPSWGLPRSCSLLEAVVLCHVGHQVFFVRVRPAACKTSHG
jgi:SacI homology domain